MSLGGLAPKVRRFRCLLRGGFFISVSKSRIRGNGIGIGLAMGQSSVVFRVGFRVRNIIVIPYSEYLSSVRVPVSARGHLIMGFNGRCTRRDSRMIIVPRSRNTVGLT